MEVKPWQRLVLDALRELSDPSFQVRVWLRREGEEISSPGETVNQLFDDSGLGDLLEDGLVFSEEADSALRKLGKYVDTIDFERSVAEILADGRWQEVRQLASKAMSEVSRALGGA